ncbi:hypothetical protein HNP25_000759 [Arcicella rosea]|uniref:DUF4440 domain-containing protein n=1 Tax=Arcicella rosea TaxID=502909 RepID=A0A841EPB6_9BACT|nr:hypothetical protein [Arcicella rosea]
MLKRLVVCEDTNYGKRHKLRQESTPIFTDNNEFAFIDLTVYFKVSTKQPLDDAYFGTIALVFQKNRNTWKRIAIKNWLIL